MFETKQAGEQGPSPRSRLREALNAIGMRALECLEVDEIVNMVGAELEELKLAVVIAIFDGQGHLILRYTSPPSVFIKAIEQRLKTKVTGQEIDILNNPFLMRLFQNRGSMLASDPAEVIERALPGPVTHWLQEAIELWSTMKALSVPLRARGRTLGLLSVYSPELRDEDGPLLEALGHQVVIAMDNARLIEETGRAEALWQFSKLKDQLQATISQSLKDPLSAVVGSSELLAAHEYLSEETKSIVQEIHRSSQYLAAIVNELLEMSQLEAASIQLNKKPTDLKSLLREGVTHFAPVSPLHHFRFDLEEDLPAAPVDAEMLRKVLSHLFSNAVNYSPDGGAISIKAKRQEGNVLVSIADTGVGIAAEELERIFEKFYRAKSPLQPKVRGAGLGLAISKYIIEAHGGKIWAESQLGKGTTFHFTIPLASTP